MTSSEEIVYHIYIDIRDIIYILFVSPGDKDSTTEINIYIYIKKELKMSIYTYWEKKKSHIATLTLVICCIINVNIYQVQPSNEHVHQRSNANIFLDEKDLVMGKSETHVEQAGIIFVYQQKY